LLTASGLRARGGMLARPVEVTRGVPCRKVALGSSNMLAI
jgi:hypothetical protein